MKINWRVRFKNKVWLTSFTALIIGFVYQVLGLIGVVPVIAEDKVTELVTMIITVLAALGIVVDPTTDGMCDSDEAMNYCKDKE